MDGQEKSAIDRIDGYLSVLYRLRLLSIFCDGHGLSDIGRDIE